MRHRISWSSTGPSTRSPASRPSSRCSRVAVLAWLAAARVGPAAAAGVLLLAVLLAPGVSSHSKWALLVVLASGAIVGLSFTRMAPRT